jgi:hypothetical protein
MQTLAHGPLQQLPTCFYFAGLASRFVSRSAALAAPQRELWKHRCHLLAHDELFVGVFFKHDVPVVVVSNHHSDVAFA